MGGADWVSPPLPNFRRQMSTKTAQTWKGQLATRPKPARDVPGRGEGRSTQIGCPMLS